MTWTPNLKKLEDRLLIGSTLVEGSTLSEKESQAVLAGRTVQGHSVLALRELTNYRAAVEWLIKQLAKSPYLAKDLIRDFHRRLFFGLPGEHGQWKRANNYTYSSSGDRFDFLKPGEVESAMTKWLELFNSVHEKDSAAVLLQRGAQLYYDFQFIHPFADGNGRIGRVMIAYWFHWRTQLEFSFYLKDKLHHLKSLESANSGDFAPLQNFFKKRLSKE